MKWEYKTTRYADAGACSTRANVDEPDTKSLSPISSRADR